MFGSTKNGTAGPSSDIDLLLHVEGDDGRRRELALWLDGWSQSLAEANYLRTGYRTDGLLDVHYVTDGDIAGGDEPVRVEDRGRHRRGAPAAARAGATAGER